MGYLTQTYCIAVRSFPSIWIGRPPDALAHSKPTEPVKQMLQAVRNGMGVGSNLRAVVLTTKNGRVNLTVTLIKVCTIWQGSTHGLTYRCAVAPSKRAQEKASAASSVLDGMMVFALSKGDPSKNQQAW